MKHFIFDIKGSAEEPYRVDIWFQGRLVNAICDCAAGQNGQYCKHRDAIFRGDTSAIVSGNATDALEVVSLFDETNAKTMLANIQSLEAEIETKKKLLTSQKKALARSLNNGT